MHIGLKIFAFGVNITQNEKWGKFYPQNRQKGACWLGMLHAKVNIEYLEKGYI